MKLSKVALAAALIFGVSGFAVAQDRDHDRDDRGGWREGSNREERSEAYQDGFHEGQRDRVRNRGSAIRTEVPRRGARAADG